MAINYSKKLENLKKYLEVMEKEEIFDLDKLDELYTYKKMKFRNPTKE